MKVIIGRDALHFLNIKFHFDESGKIDIHVAGCSRNESPAKIEFLKLFNLPKYIQPNHQRILQELLYEYRDVFSKGDWHIGKTDGAEHFINTGVAEPNYTKQYRLPHSQKAEAETYIQDMKKHGIIEQANSPWSSPFILVKKKDGTNRFVIDYRKLNNKTVKDRMPIPNVEELIDNLSQSSIFSLLDLTSGYWQVPLAEQTKRKNCICTEQ